MSPDFLPEDESVQECTDARTANSLPVVRHSLARKLT